MSEFNDERWPERPAGDRGGAAAHSDRTKRHEGGRWPDRSSGSRRSAQDYDTSASEYEGGYGGGRERGEQWPEHGFGDRGWGGGRGSGISGDWQRGRRDLPEGAHPVPDGPEWQERYARENAGKYGQWGGQPIAQRGSAQSLGGYEHREPGLGSTHDISERGGMGLRETETLETGSRGHAGRGPKNYRRSDEQVCEEVNRRLTEHPDLDASDIEVHVTECEVTLSGHVDERRSKYLAEDIAYEVHGVREVHNRIRLMSRERTGLHAGEPTTK
jgi:hypothetical protein